MCFDTDTTWLAGKCSEAETESTDTHIPLEENGPSDGLKTAPSVIGLWRGYLVFERAMSYRIDNAFLYREPMGKL